MQFLTDIIDVGILVPNNATNGDVIRSLFPNTQVRNHVGTDFIEYTLDGIVGNTVGKKWWDAKYKGGE